MSSGGVHLDENTEGVGLGKDGVYERHTKTGYIWDT